jgi:hypothetical protein
MHGENHAKARLVRGVGIFHSRLSDLKISPPLIAREVLDATFPAIGVAAAGRLVHLGLVNWLPVPVCAPIQAMEQ